MNSYQTEEIDYPDLETYKRNLNELSDFDFSNSTYREIYDKFHDLALTLPMLGAKLKTVDGINGHKLYRARLSKTIAKEEDLSIIQTFSFPLSTFCKTNQRANIKHKSVFYCADEAFPAIKECGIQDEEEGYLSVWEIAGKRDLKYATCLPLELPNKNGWAEYGIYHHDFLIKEQSALNKTLLNHKVALRNFITYKFMNEKPPYSLSSMLANEYMYENGVDLIMYPSAKTFQEYTNFAIHPNVVQTQLKCNKIYKFKVIKQDKEQVRIKFISIGHIANDKIEWKKPTDKDGTELGFRKLK
ncbi:hypothetical protein [uncultured Algibacter sp.]|uniref:hypothetical protein n=1 Tax=uncultured Algibacter sp. TaxID=298659 RepID=UPI0026387215|nr:hypothetical protein [uncultured Algibacter sp.]